MPEFVHARDRAERAILRCAAGTVGHRYIAWAKARQPGDCLLQRLCLRVALRREELEGDGRRPSLYPAHVRRAHSRASFLPLPTSAARRSSAVQIVTVSPPDPAPGARSSAASRRRPAAAIHCFICAWLKPSLRCAWVSRRCSSSCGAKSTIRSRPPAESAAAASPIARPAHRENAAPDG